MHVHNASHPSSHTPPDPNCPTKPAAELQRQPVYVRQVLNTDKTFPVRERMLKRYSAQVRGGSGLWVGERTGRERTDVPVVVVVVVVA